MMDQHREKVAFEPRDWRLRVVLWTGLGVVLFTIFGFLYSTVFYKVYRPHGGRIATYPTSEEMVQTFPDPRLRPIESAQWQQVREEALQRLHSYGWVDRRAGIVHIPIDRAMELILERGLPTRENPRELKPAIPMPPQAMRRAPEGD